MLMDPIRHIAKNPKSVAAKNLADFCMNVPDLKPCWRGEGGAAGAGKAKCPAGTGRRGIERMCRITGNDKFMGHKYYYIKRENKISRVIVLGF